MNIPLLLPLLIPFLTAIMSLLAWNRLYVQRVLNVIGAFGLLVAGLNLLNSVWQHGIQAVQIGNWPAPFGITLVADLFSAMMVVLTGIIGLAIGVYSLVGMDTERESFGYYPLLHVLLMGISGAFLTGDLFNMYVWFEVMLTASFVLIALGGERAQFEGAIKYVTLNLLSSAIFLTALGLLYGLAGTLNMAQLGRELSQIPPSGLVTTLAMLFLVAFGIKAAAFPLYFWLPASYHTPPTPVSAIFAGLLTKVGVYALIRVFTLLFTQNINYTHTLILIIAGLTMVSGILGALAQTDFRRILSFNLVSHIGYMLMGLGIFSPLALAGSVFYIAHHIIVKANLFLVSGVVQRLGGSNQLPKLGGLYRKHPGVAAVFFISALSLAGVPPFSGFWPKLTLVQAGLDLKQYAIVATALVVSLLTLYSMVKIWDDVFLKVSSAADDQKLRPTAAPVTPGVMASLLLPIVVLAALSLTIGLWSEPIFILTKQAAEQLLNPTEYIRVVLGESL